MSSSMSRAARPARLGCHVTARRTVLITVAFALRFMAFHQSRHAATPVAAPSGLVDHEVGSRVTRIPKWPAGFGESAHGSGELWWTETGLNTWGARGGHA